MELAFKTKKAAGDAGYRTQKKWFAAFFTPKLGDSLACCAQAPPSHRHYATAKQKT